jgi:hypothetical protein
VRIVRPVALAILTGTSILTGLGTPAEASEWELQGLVGFTAPTYSQSFSWSPPPLPSVPGVEIQQGGSFDLEATGGTALAGSLTWFPVGGVGLEARIDTGDVSLETRNARFAVRVPLPAPFPDIDADLELEPATVDLKRVTPVSLNLRLRTPGAFSLNVSGGVSYLPALELSVVQPLAVGVSGLDVFLGDLDVGEVPIVASPAATDNESRLGANLGVGIQVRLGESVFLVVDARGFLFPEQQIVWSAAPGRELSPAEQVVVDEVLRQLQPIEFSPTLINATAGISISF